MRRLCWALLAIGLALPACGDGGSTGDDPFIGEFVAISAGVFHSCAVASDGTAWCWGDGWAGKLGTGSLDDQLTPARVVGLSGVVAISTGIAHSCAVVSDGTAWCWGGSRTGRLGDGQTTHQVCTDDFVEIDCSPVPVQVAGLSNVAAISVGERHTCAVTNDGTAWCWGDGGDGQLGHGDYSSSSTPQAVTGLTNVVDISAGGYEGSGHSCAVVLDGTAWCWGFGGAGQLGHGSLDSQPTPVQVAGLSNVVAISAGSHHSCAITSDRMAWCWGFGGFGQLGDGQTTHQVCVDDSDCSPDPVQVAGLSSVVAISAGVGHTCAVDADGATWCWGWNTSGTLGDGQTSHQVCFDELDCSRVPVPVAGLSSVVAISAGSVHTCTVRTDGTAWCWGGGNLGQLGNGTTDDQLTPVQVADPP